MFGYTVFCFQDISQLQFSGCFCQDETSLIQSDAITKFSHLDVNVASCCSRCPIPGCLQTRVTATDLEEHHELKLKLGRTKQASGRDMA